MGVVGILLASTVFEEVSSIRGPFDVAVSKANRSVQRRKRKECWLGSKESSAGKWMRMTDKGHQKRVRKKHKTKPVGKERTWGESVSGTERDETSRCLKELLRGDGRTNLKTGEI